MLDVSNHEVVDMDYLMDGLNGVTACRNILARHPTARIILISGAVDPRELSLIRSGACAILQKPVTGQQLHDLLDSLVPRPPRDEDAEEYVEKSADPSRFF